MDTKLIQQVAENLERVPSEIKTLTSGSTNHDDDLAIFKATIAGTKIKNSTPVELKVMLAYCMALVGIRGNNLPTDTEKDVLLNFIHNQYGNLALSEIRLAFDMAIAGKLDVNVTCYENFSSAYFASVMNAYKRWANQQFEEKQLYAPEPKPMLANGYVNWMELCEHHYQNYLNGRYNFTTMPAELYDEFVRSEYMAPEVYLEYLSASYAAVVKKLSDERDVYIKQRHALKAGNILNELGDIKRYGLNHVKVIAHAKKMAVDYLYSEAKKQGIKNLFVQE